jgi:hypothetical protein
VPSWFGVWSRQRVGIVIVWSVYWAVGAEYSIGLV